MRDLAAARRYASALVALAVEDGSEATIQADMEAWSGLLTSDDGADLFRTLSSPVFALDERRAVVGAVCEKLGTSATVFRFLSLLIDRDRFAALPDIARLVTEDLDARAGRIRVQVRSAVALTPALEAELASAFEKSTGKAVTLETEVDASLLGGLVARLGSRVYDASLRTRLTDLKQRLIHDAPPAEA